MSTLDTRILDEAFEALPAELKRARPRCGFILGSGWSSVVDRLQVAAEYSYEELPVLGATAVVGHAGRLVLASLPGNPEYRALFFCGRRHWYEGVGWEPIVLPIEICRRLGVGDLLITNAAGGIRPDLKPGDMVLLRDHLRMSHLNPLRGPHHPRFGPRFPDQSEVYSAGLADRLREAAADIGTELAEGVYTFAAGPSFETPAEIRAYGMLGGDVVGMSTVPEAMVAAAAGINVAAVSLVSNMAAGIDGPQLSHEEVLQVARDSTPRMTALIEAFLRRLAKTHA